MAYKRQIAYLDYMEYGEKKGNGGFCKWEQRNGVHTLEVSISGLKGRTSENARIVTKSGSELGNLQVKQGSARTIFARKDGDNWEEELAHIRIPLSEERELVAGFPTEAIGKIKEQQPEKEEEKVLKQPLAVEAEEKPLLQKIEAMVKELTVKKEPVQLPEEEPVQLPEKEPLRLSENASVQLPIKEEIQEIQEQQPLSLWDWLEQTHDKMRPFGTQAEYFRLAVEDIYRLKEEYHVLRNNQFLLHGYYNYHYLILGKKNEGENVYWLGVPGIYHEREKMAARMYGFEKFEGAKPGYRTGDLGYYLITAE